MSALRGSPVRQRARARLETTRVSPAVITTDIPAEFQTSLEEEGTQPALRRAPVSFERKGSAESLVSSGIRFVIARSAAGLLRSSQGMTRVDVANEGKERRSLSLLPR